MEYSETVNAERLNLFSVLPEDIGITLLENGVLLFTEIPGLEEALKEAGIETENKQMSFCG